MSTIKSILLVALAPADEKRLKDVIGQISGEGGPLIISTNSYGPAPSLIEHVHAEAVVLWPDKRYIRPCRKFAETLRRNHPRVSMVICLYDDFRPDYSKDQWDDVGEGVTLVQASYRGLYETAHLVAGVEVPTGEAT